MYYDYYVYFRVSQILGTDFWIVSWREEVLTIFYCERGIEFVEQMFRSIFSEAESMR